MRAKAVHAEIKCAKCGYLNLVLTHMSGTLEYDGHKFGTVPDVDKITI
jgi:hypothetical protein